MHRTGQSGGVRPMQMSLRIYCTSLFQFKYHRVQYLSTAIANKTGILMIRSKMAVNYECRECYK